MSVATCPRCRRPTPVGQPRCLYCAVPLPPEIASATRELPANLDELVAKALGGGGAVAVARVRDAMRQAPRPALDDAAPAPPLPPPGLPGIPAVERGRTAPAVQDSAPAPPAAPPAPPSADQLADLLAEARVALKRDHRAEARAHLRALREATDRLLASLEDAPAAEEPGAGPPVVELPPVRKRCVLVVEGLGDAARAGDLALALGVDAATARQIALSRYSRVSLRADAPERLQERAAQLHDAGIRARVVERASLEAMAPATLLLALVEPDRGPLASPWRVTWRPHWQQVHPPDPEVLAEGSWEQEALPILLAVPGEIVVERHAAARDLGRTTHRRYANERSLGETRVPVLDLHGPEVHLRLVPGFTAAPGWPGGEARSAVQAWRGLLDGLSTALPGVVGEGVRVCAPPRERPVEDEGPGRDRRVTTVTGWPTFEEHSRLCRLLHGLLA